MSVLKLLVIDGGSKYITDLLEVLTPENGVEVAGRARDIASLIESSARTTPDVVLIDAEAASDGASDVLAKVPELFPEAHIFVVTPPEDLEAMRRAQDRPAIGMITKEAKPDEVLAAMRHAGSGAIIMHRAFVADRVAELPYFPRRTAERVSGSPLTPRETEVLSMLSRGTHVDAIARKLNLSVHTVRGHVKNILAKLDSHSQLEAVAKAKDRGWLPR
jgi:DNA-binding NarL/FixJ family response regulator